MESPPLASNGPSMASNGQPHYNGAPYHNDFGPETDVDGNDLHVKPTKALNSDQNHVLNLSSGGSSSDSEVEGVEGGGWDYVQGGQNVKDTLHSHSKIVDSEDSDDDMNHPLNPNAAEFVPVHSPVHKTNVSAGGDGFFGDKNGHAPHENGNDESDDFASFKPQESSENIKTGVKNPFETSIESNDFAASKEPSDDHKEKTPFGTRNGFESNTHHFESDNRFSSDFTGFNEEVKQETRLESDLVQNGASHSSIDQYEKDASSVSEYHTVNDASFAKAGDETLFDKDATQVGLTQHEGSYLNVEQSATLDEDLLGTQHVESQEKEDPIIIGSQIADFTGSQFDASTFSEHHTNDVSFAKAGEETLSFFEKEPTKTELSSKLGSFHSGLDEDLADTLFGIPTGRRVSNDVLEAYQSVAHSLDSPDTRRAALVEDIALLGQGDSWFQNKEEKKEDSGAAKANPFASTNEIVRSEPRHEDTNDKSNDQVEETPYVSETDEFEFHRGANLSDIGTIDVSSNFGNTVNLSNSTFTSVEFDDIDRVVSETVVPGNFNEDIHGIQKSNVDVDNFRDSFNELKEEDEDKVNEAAEVASQNVDEDKEKFGGYNEAKEGKNKEYNANKKENEEHNVKDKEEEDEIQIGQEVSGLNESDLMSRSFYGEFEEEPARSPSPEEMIDHYERQLREEQEKELEETVTPTAGATTLEAKLAEEEQASAVEQEHKTDVFEAQSNTQVTETCLFELSGAEKTTKVTDTLFETNQAQSTEQENKTDTCEIIETSAIAQVPASNLFEISQEEAMFANKTQEFDDLTFGTKATPEPEPSIHEPAPVTLAETSALISTDESQDTHVEQPREKASQEIVAETVIIPDVVPQEEASQEEEASSAPETAGEKAIDLSTVVAAGALVVGATAAAVAVKKATGPKKPEVKTVANKTAKTVPAKPATSKPTSAKPMGTTTKPMGTAAKPATSAKPAPKPLSKPLAPKPAVSKVSATVPKPMTTKKPVTSTTKKPVTSSLTKTSTSSSMAAKPATLKRKPAPASAKPLTNGVANPLTNGVAKKPVSATTTAAPRVPLSQRPTTRSASLTRKPAPTTSKLNTSATTKPAALKPSTAIKSSATAKPAPSKVAGSPSPVAAKSSPSAKTITRSPLTPKSPAKATGVPAVKTSPVTRKPLSAITSKVGSLPAKTKPAMTKKTEMEESNKDSKVKNSETTIVENGVSAAPVEGMTNGH